MRILVFGAGVIGQIYAGRLHAAGHDVHLLARGQTAAAVRDNGIRLDTGRGSAHHAVTVVETPAAAGYDLALVAIRRDQLDSAEPALRQIRADSVVFLANTVDGVADLRSALGAARVRFGFPGVGGYRAPDKSIRYVEIQQQPTTLETIGDGTAEAALQSAEFPLATTGNIDAWLKTHAVFIVAMGLGILSCGGDPVALANDHVRLNHTVRAVREGFRALSAQGVTVTPAALKTISTLVPHPFALRYWRRRLRSGLGTIALAPHIRQTQTTEFPALLHDVQRLLANSPTKTPHFQTLLPNP